MPHPCPFPGRALRTAAALLAAGALARAQVQVALDPPDGPLASGQAHTFEARVTGAAGGPEGCHWAVVEQGRRVGARAGVVLVPQGRRAVLTVTGRSVARWLRVRATSRQDPSAFAVVTVEVAPGGPAGEAKGAAPAGGEAAGPREGKATGLAEDLSTVPTEDKADEQAVGKPAGGARGCAAGQPGRTVASPAEGRATGLVEGEAGDPAEGRPPVAVGGEVDEPAGPEDGPASWATPFTRTGGRRSFNAIAWDVESVPPSVLALEDLGDRAQVVRLGLDGSETVVGPPPRADGAAGAWPDPPHLDRSCDSLAVLPGGDVAVSDGGHRRICRIAARDGALTVLAGTGSGDFDGDEDEQGRPRPATRAALGCPAGLAVTPAGVVFADAEHHRIRRFRPGGTIETLAGSGQGRSPVDNDLDRRHPATAASLDRPYALAAAPDGRVVFGQVAGGLAILHPDGTLERLPGFRGLASLVTVATRNEIITWDAHRWLGRIGPGGRPERLSESRLPLQGLTAVPGGGVLVLDRYSQAIWLVDPVRDGGRLAGRVNAAGAAALAGDLATAAALRAGLARWAEAVPPTVAAVRDLLRCSRSGTRLPGLIDDLQDLPWTFLQGDYLGQAVRARIALWALDRELERRVPGLPGRLVELAAGGAP